jgi:hypothetical protein
LGRKKCRYALGFVTPKLRSGGWDGTTRGLGARNGGYSSHLPVREVGDIPYYDNRIYLGESKNLTANFYGGVLQLQAELSFTAPGNTIARREIILDLSMPDGTISSLTVPLVDGSDGPMCYYNKNSGQEIKPPDLASIPADRRQAALKTYAAKLRSLDAQGKNCAQ